MRRRTVRRWSIAAGVVASGSIAVVLAFALNGAAPAAPAVEGEGMPTALAGHLARLQALPGNGGMSAEGPGGAADSEFRNLAYPDTTVSVAEMNGAREAFTDVAGVPYRAGEGDGRWETIGPSRALYPRSDFLTSFLYVPNTYVAGGRTTDIAISDHCTPGRCEAYITPAGGGVWHTKNVFERDVDWEYLGGPLGINAAGSVTIDPNDPSGKTVYVGTGEANICGSGCVAGTGLYKSTNRGQSWKLLGKTEFQGKGIGEIIVHPNDKKTLYVASTTALRGMSSVCCTGVTRPVPGIAKWGLYKSTDGGSTWSFIHNGSVDETTCTGDLNEFNNVNPAACSPRGVRSIELDPSNPSIIYAASYARGVWRSDDAGANWTQIKPSLNPAIIQTRPAISVNKLASGATRMYVYEGHTGASWSEHHPSALEALPQRQRRHGSAGLHRPDEPRSGTAGVRHVQPLRRTVLVRRVRLHAQGSSGHGVRRRLVFLRREHRQQARRRPLDGCRRHLDGHDVRRDGLAPPEWAPSRPARHRRPPERPEQVRRDERRRRHAVERRVRQPLVLVQ